MKDSKWRRIRDGILMALAWGAVWAPVAVVVGLIVDPDGSMDEMWPAIGAYPGFLSAVVFSVVLALAERQRGIDALPIWRAAAWGALSGLPVGALPWILGTPSPEAPPWLPAGVIGVVTLMSAVSAVGSVLVLRTARAHRATVRDE